MSGTVSTPTAMGHTDLACRILVCVASGVEGLRCREHSVDHLLSVQARMSG